MTFLSPLEAIQAKSGLSPRDQLRRAAAVSQGVTSSPSCQIEVHIGVFFDGTNNNKKRDQEAITDPKKRSHSNVVVLHDTYANTREHHYRIYIPGVGTPFPKIGELTESSKGKAMAKGGTARIYWAMIQVINSLHRAGMGGDLVSDEQATKFVTSPMFLGSQNLLNKALAPDSAKRTAVFERLGRELADKLKRKKSPTIRVANLSVFGFSRGAAEARTFCNWMNDLAHSLQFGDTFFSVPLRFQFVGLFDTVASVGLAASSPIPSDGGFMAWADGTMELPACIERCVHFTAAHEIRKSFPLSTTRRSQCITQEFIYPGAHSDVGGGYAPGEQGKGRTRSELLSQVPLIHMYHEARKAGVPLMDEKELDEYQRGQTIDDLRLDPEVARHFNEYRRVGPGGGEIRKTLLEHMRFYWRWRLQAGPGFSTLPSYRNADEQDREDLSASEMDFRRDLAIAEQDERALAEAKQHPAQAVWGNVAVATSLGYNPGVARPYLTEAEKAALAEKRSGGGVPSVVGDFFDRYMHDSHASFYLVGPTTAYDRQTMIRDVLAKEKEGKPLNGFEQRVAELQKSKPGAFPKMADADYKNLLDMDGLENKAVVDWLGMSATRRESDGHVRERMIFDKS